MLAEACVVVVLAFGAGSTQAADVAWIVTDDPNGDWSDPANWSTGVVPGEGDDVLLPDDTLITEVPSDVELRSLRTAATGGRVHIVDESADGRIELAQPSRLSGFVLGGVRLRSAGALTLADGAIHDGELDAFAGLHIEGYDIELIDTAVTVTGSLTGSEESVGLFGSGTYVQRSGAVNRPLRVDGVATAFDGEVQLTGAGTFSGPVRVRSGSVTFDADSYLPQLDVEGGEATLVASYVSVLRTTGGVTTASGGRLEALHAGGDSIVRIDDGNVMEHIAVTGAEARVQLGGADRDHATYVGGRLTAREHDAVEIVGHVAWRPQVSGIHTGLLRLAPNARLWVEDELRLGAGFAIAGGSGSAMVIASGALTLDPGADGAIDLDTTVVNEVLSYALSGSTTMRRFENMGTFGIGGAQVTAEHLVLGPEGYTFFEIGERDAQLRATGHATLNGPVGMYLDPSYTTPPASTRVIPVHRWGSRDGSVEGFRVSAFGHPLADRLEQPRVTSDTLFLAIRGTATPPAPPMPTTEVPVIPNVAPPVDPLPRLPAKVTPIGPLRVLGTRANDVITGSRRGDTLSGGAGSDVIRGGEGNDRIVGGPGRDKLAGDSGNDVINARDGKPGDTVSCGTGRDTVTADLRDKVARDCEKVMRR